ncbi:hypothetical protein ACIOEZ_34125 [Streptomyces sp. NPDC087866]|uniref:hypothetical protein n=1 Tax=Streptomyces sp. NPDC087866 TaxID=3365815 RepID=UPI0038153B03
MTSPRRTGTRGRPPVFDTALQAAYLDAVRAGMRLAPAAAHVGISRNTPTRAARTDTAFRQALADAKTQGRKTRLDEVPHGEARYNNYGCHCTTCTTAATTARTKRRHTEPGDDSGESAQVVDLPAAPAGVESPSLLLLRIAS